MPLYEYECTLCSERVEVIQRMSDPPYSHCPKCSGPMKKLISSPAIQFKGSGFYKTDYGSGSSGSAGRSSSKAEKSESSSESKGSSSEKKSE